MSRGAGRKGLSGMRVCGLLAVVCAVALGGAGCSSKSGEGEKAVEKASVPGGGGGSGGGARSSSLPASANEPVTPFQIAGNLYYVGAGDVTAYLITTSAGHILIDGGLPETAAQIEKNIQTLGFRLEDVEILLNSHAHFDHAGGLAELRKRTGAKFYASAGDAAMLESGGEGAPGGGFPAVKPDRLLQDGDKVWLGSMELVAHVTPGHTRGCTTWSTWVHEGRQKYSVVFVCSTSVLPDYRLVEQPTYPGIAKDYARTFQVLESLPCDIFLGAHGSFFGLRDKMERMGKRKANPFMDAAGYRAYVRQSKKRFQDELAKQEAAAKGAVSGAS